MALKIEWMFFCESVDVDSDNIVTSVHAIIRPGSGFGARSFPFECEPVFYFGFTGVPGETVTLNTTISEGRTLLATVPLGRFTVPRTGMGELVTPCGSMKCTEPGTLTFGLKINGAEVFAIKAPLERMM